MARFTSPSGPSYLFQREDNQRPTQVGVVGKGAGQADCAQSLRSLCESFCQPNGCPAAYASKHGDVLIAIVMLGDGVADYARRRVELL
jgi:hypothetical protein